jgi:PHD/YefM family antitoxin component YafN of YafNO toxin-antitoxin module
VQRTIIAEIEKSGKSLIITRDNKPVAILKKAAEKALTIVE